MRPCLQRLPAWSHMNRQQNITWTLVCQLKRFVINNSIVIRHHSKSTSDIAHFQSSSTQDLPISVESMKSFLASQQIITSILDDFAGNKTKSMETFLKNQPTCKQFIPLLRDAVDRNIPLSSHFSMIASVIINHMRNKSELAPDDVCFLFEYVVFHCMEASDRNRKKVGIALLKRLHHLGQQQKQPSISTSTIAKFTYGLRYVSIDNRESQLGSQFITNQLMNVDNVFTSHQLCLMIMNCRTFSGMYEFERHLLTAITKKIKTLSILFDMPQIVLILESFTNKSSNHACVRSLVHAMIPSLQAMKGYFPNSVLSVCIHGLCGLQSTREEVKTFLKALVPLIPPCDQPLTSKELTNMLYGTKQMDFDHIEVKGLLKKLLPYVKASSLTKVATNSEIATALNCFKNHSLCVEVRNLLAAYLPVLAHFTGNFTGNEICQILHGIELLNSSSTSVRTLICLLIPHIERLQSIDGFDIYALTWMYLKRSSHEEVRQLLTVLTNVMQAHNMSHLLSSSYDIAKALHVMRDFDTDYIEVRRWLKLVIIPAIGKVNQRSVASYDIMLGISGLRLFRTEHPESTTLLELLIPLVNKSDGSIEVKHICKAYFGLKSMTNFGNPVVSAMIQALANKPAKMTNVFDIRLLHIFADASQNKDFDDPALHTVMRLLSTYISNFKHPKISIELSKEFIMALTLTTDNSLKADTKELISNLVRMVLKFTVTNESELAFLSSRIDTFTSTKGIDKSAELTSQCDVGISTKNNIMMQPQEVFKTIIGLKSVDINSLGAHEILQKVTETLESYKSQVFSKKQTETMILLLTSRAHNEQTQSTKALVKKLGNLIFKLTSLH